MFIDATINSRSSKSTLIDSGVTHNFIVDQEARRLGLTIEKDPRKVKAVNFEALPIVGVSKRVPFKLGAWSGQMDLVMVCMDDFDGTWDGLPPRTQSYPNATGELLGDY